MICVFRQFRVCNLISFEGVGLGQRPFLFQKNIVSIEIMIFICYTHFVIEIITKYVYVFLSCRRKCDQKSMKEVVRCPLLSFNS